MQRVVPKCNELFLNATSCYIFETDPLTYVSWSESGVFSPPPDQAWTFKFWLRLRLLLLPFTIPGSGSGPGSDLTLNLMAPTSAPTFRDSDVFQKASILMLCVINSPLKQAWFMTSKTLLNLPRSPWQSKRLPEAAKFTLCVRTHARDLSRYIALRVCLKLNWFLLKS